MNSKWRRGNGKECDISLPFGEGLKFASLSSFSVVCIIVIQVSPWPQARNRNF